MRTPPIFLALLYNCYPTPDAMKGSHSKARKRGWSRLHRDQRHQGLAKHHESSGLKRSGGLTCSVKPMAPPHRKRNAASGLGQGQGSPAHGPKGQADRKGVPLPRQWRGLCYLSLEAQA